MARRPQVGIELDNDLDRMLETLAAKAGKSRAECVRGLIREGYAADLEGRGIFSKPAAADQIRVAELIYRVGEMTTELDRVFRQTSSRERDLQKASRREALSVNEIQRATISELGERLVKILWPMQEQLTALSKQVADPPPMAKIATALAEVKTVAEVPKTQIVIGFGEVFHAWPVAFLWLFASTLLGFVFLMTIAAIAPQGWVAVPIANRLLGPGDQAICTLVEYRTRATGCTTISGGREVGVRVRTVPGTNP